MAKHVGVEREERGLTTALETLAHIARHASGDRLIENAVLVARFVAECALRRRESRGAHYRTDYPEPKAEFQRRSSITLPGLERKSGRRANSALGTSIGRAGDVLP
jgi:L-aspartate oxidase